MGHFNRAWFIAVPAVGFSSKRGLWATDARQAETKGVAHEDFGTEDYRPVGQGVQQQLPKGTN